MRLMHFAAVALCAVTTGCETFTPPTQATVVIKDKVTVLDTTATRRGTYLINKPATNGEPARWVMVAEPPPDAAIASAVKAAVDANATTQTGSGSLDLAQTLTQIQQTQTVLVARDLLFRLSEAYANGVIGKTEYTQEYEKALNVVQSIANATEDKAKSDVLKQQSSNTILNDKSMKLEDKLQQLQLLSK